MKLPIRHKILFQKKKIHGHELILENEKIFQHLGGKTLLEIGSERGQGSTLTLANLADRLGMNFVTVDVDEKITDKIREKVCEINPRFEAITEDGPVYLKKCKKDIGIAYLDGFDCWHPNHPPERILGYKERGVELTWGRRAETTWR